MAKITRPNINVQGFASSPQSQERTTFGTETESTNLADFLTPEFLRGWGVLPVGGKPPYQWFNGAIYFISQLQAMQFQQGIPEYATSQEFHKNSLTAKNGVLFRSKTDNNIGNDPETDATNWDISNAFREGETYAIGSTGDFANINEALESLSLRRPVYSNAGVKVVLELESGFVMQEQVLVRGIDLSWIEIAGVDAETVVDRASLTVDISNGENIYPVFGVSDGGKAPRISQLFSMNRSGDDFLKKGVYTVGAGSSISVSPNKGVKNVYGDGLHCDQSSLVSAFNADFSGATNVSILFSAASAGDVSVANSSGSDIGLRALSSANVNAEGIDASGCISSGILCNRAYINANNSNARIGSADSSDDIKCFDGGVVQARNSQGGTNIASNTVNASGIIFK